MATIGHLGAGLAASRLVGLGGGRRASLAEAATITLAGELPDVDLLLPLQHRGRTHSIGFACVVGAGAAAVTGVLGRGGGRAVRIGLVAALAVSSHAVLDLLTGESGDMAAWPISRTRLHLPVSSLPAADPRPASLVTQSGLLAAVGELAWTAPLALIGAWPFLEEALRKRRW